MKVTKKFALQLQGLINDLTMASDAVSRQCAKDKPDTDRIEFWMADHDVTILKLRSLLGVHVAATYAEIQTQYQEAA